MTLETPIKSYPHTQSVILIGIQAMSFITQLYSLFKGDFETATYASMAGSVSVGLFWTKYLNTKDEDTQTFPSQLEIKINNSKQLIGNKNINPIPYDQ